MLSASNVPSRRLLVVLAVACSAAGVCPTVVSAGTISAEHGSARFTDGAGVDDLIHLGVHGDETGSAWVFTTDVADPTPAAGPGCEITLGLGGCAFGATPPQSVLVDVGAGDDHVRYSSTVRTATTVRLLGGAGDDILRKYEARGELDGGEGADTLRPDDHYSIVQLPPQPTPGDTVRGGAGIDTAEYDGTEEAFRISLDGVANDGRPGERDNVMPDVENVTGSQLGNVLVGSDVANALQGGGANDQLTGGRGRDRLSAGAGDDTIDALDGAAGDSIDCSDGFDVAFVDAGDVLADDASCDEVRWAPGLAASRLRYRGGRIAVALSCPAASRAPCRGRLLLRTAGTRPAVLASASYSVRRGGRATLRLTPSSAGRSMLARDRSLRAEALVQLRGSATPSAVRRVTILR